MGIFRLAALAAAFACLTVSSAAGAESAADSLPHFKIKFPCETGEPKKDGTKVGLRCRTDAGSYMFILDTVPDGTDEDSLTATNVLNIAAAVEGTVRTQNKIAVQGVSGLEALIDLNASATTVRMRIFVHDGILAGITFVCASGDETGDEANAFFDSFGLE